MAQSYFANPFPETGLNVREPQIDPREEARLMGLRGLRSNGIGSQQMVDPRYRNLPIIGAQQDPFDPSRPIPNGPFSMPDNSRLPSHFPKVTPGQGFALEQYR